MTLSLEKYPAWVLSMAAHGLLLVLFLILFAKQSSTKRIDFEVLDYTQMEVKTLNLQPSRVEDVKKNKDTQEKRQVFGVSRKSILSTSPNQEAATVKQGNTLAKAPDDLTLQASDQDSIPIPTDEYLISNMPVLDSEFRIPYPEEARRAGVEGPVVMDLLIDQNGKVRKVDLISGPGFGLNEAATQAIVNFKFRAAQIENQAVAVKIRYTYRFVLESK